jgi:hypothetical protein
VAKSLAVAYSLREVAVGGIILEKFGTTFIRRGIRY